MTPTPPLLYEACEWLRRSTSTVVFSGAGLSKASGIPTYRDDDDGLWRHPDNARFSSIAGVLADMEGARSFWKGHQRKLADARPNPAHFALRDLQAAIPDCTLITQNVDGLLTDAGCSNVMELHGSLRRFHCQAHPEFKSEEDVPCGECGQPLRPSVILFGEDLALGSIYRANTAVQRAHVMVVVGTSLDVHPANHLLVSAVMNFSKLILIDPNPPEIPEYLGPVLNIELRGNAEDILPALVKQLTA